MAEVSKQYNLRSSKTDPIHLPGQLQLSDDSQFMAQLVQQENLVQVSDSNSSVSDLNCSDLVQSDDETSNTKNPNVSNVAPNFSDKQSTSTNVSQDTINAQILAQLQSIGQCLTKIESTQCKKTTDTGKIKSKQKSLRGGSVEVIVPNRIKWPHEYVLSGSQKERVSYDQLSITKWMTGFCRIMKEEPNFQNQKFMLQILSHFSPG